MVLMMSVGFGCLSAHSGPPLAASQGNSRARNASLAFSVCHSRCLIWSAAVAPRSLFSYSGLWFPLFPW